MFWDKCLGAIFLEENIAPKKVFQSETHFPLQSEFAC